MILDGFFNKFPNTLLHTFLWDSITMGLKILTLHMSIRPWLPKIYKSLNKEMRRKLAAASKRLKVTVKSTNSRGEKVVSGAHVP